MDFSTPTRALQSLQLRRGLNEEIGSWALRLLQQQPSNSNDDDWLQGLSFFLSRHESWEALAVGLFLATECLQQQAIDNNSANPVYVEGPRVPLSTAENKNAADKQNDDDSAVPHLSSETSRALATRVFESCKEHLEHDEPRVRTWVAKAMGAHIAAMAKDADMQQQQHAWHDQLIASIRDHLQRGRDENNPDYSKSSQGALDDTTGWRALETNWQCLACLIAAMDKNYWKTFPGTVDIVLEWCQECAIKHLNRHVRAAAIAVLEKWILHSSDMIQNDAATDVPKALWKTSVTVLKESLGDNWSQVRMAGSVLCRVFWQHAPTSQLELHPIYAQLLPRMCLNRFYLAQGVKLYSHQTWHMIFAVDNEDKGDGVGDDEETRPQGMAMVAKYIAPICRYYAKMCDADNHVVREAACQAIAELATKFGKDANSQEYQQALQPHVPLLLQALIVCFHDESWPVRDEAAVACGVFCRAYPEECFVEWPTLWERWTEQLTDQIWSVRQDAAMAIGQALLAYPKEITTVLQLLNKLLPSAKDQPKMTREEYKQYQNDIAAHTDSQLYSCGSLAPKLKKGSRKDGAGRIGGCSSCGITRPKSPWEATDGCVYLVKEVCEWNQQLPEDNPHKMSDNQLLPLLTELADVCRVRHFPQADDLRATLWRQLPAMAQALGKTRFKRLYLELFMDLLFTNLESQTMSALSQHAAQQCMVQLSNFMGKSIFRGRLEDFQQEIFDRVLREQQMGASMGMPQEPAGMSPYGPPGLLDNVGAMPPTTAMPSMSSSYM